MKKILHIISSPRGESAFSVQLGKAICEKLSAAYPGNELQELDLNKKQLPQLTNSNMIAFLTPPDKRTTEDKAALTLSDQVVSQLLATDIIVIGVPLYNYTIHSALKIWIDHILRAGVTFRYNEQGFEGLVKNKQVYLAVATGAVYSSGPMQQYDFTVPYMKAVLAHIGITDVKVCRVEGTALPEVKTGALQRAINSIEV